MADEPENEEVLELESPEVEDQPEAEETVIEIDGEEDAGEQDTPVIRQMREELKRAKQEAAELRKSVAPAKVEIGEKPNMDNYWDKGDPVGEFERDLLAWNQRKTDADRQASQASEQQQKQAQDFQRQHAAYQTRAAALPVQGFKEAEDAVVAALPMNMQEALIRYFPDAEKVVLALGRRPAVLNEISAMTDPVAQLLALKDFGSKIKMVTRNKPAPEAATIQRGSAAMSRVDPDKKLKELEKDAERTGDRTKIIQYKREMKAKEQNK